MKIDKSRLQGLGFSGLAVIGGAFGAVAIGAFAIGALSVRRLAVGDARFKSVEIEELTVRRIHTPPENVSGFSPRI